MHGPWCGEISYVEVKSQKVAKMVPEQDNLIAKMLITFNFQK